MLHKNWLVLPLYLGPCIMIVDNHDFHSKNIISLIANLDQREHQYFFEDDASLAEAIKKNEPDTVSKLTNCFFKDSLRHISQFNSLTGQYLQSDAMRYLCRSYSSFISVVNKESQDFFKDDHGTLNKKKGLGLHEKIVITIQLIIWSRVSLDCHKCICMTVLQFKCKNIGIGEREIWSWLHGFTTCVVASTSWVYDMYATDLEKKHPSCQVLLVFASIHHFLGHATKRISSTSILKTCVEIDCLSIATSYFTHFIQGRKGKECIVSLARTDQTLNFFLENNSGVWVDLIKIFSSFVEEGRVQRHRHTLEEDEELSHKDTNPDMTKFAASALVLIGRAPPIPSKQDTVASVPSVTEEKYHQLCSQLVKLKKQFKICGMVKALEHESTSMEDKRKSYQECCTKFIEMTFPVKEIKSSYDQYLIKLVAYSGLLIHDILRVKHKKDLLEHQHVFAHVLSFCLDGSYNKKKEMDWKSFFGKLVPRSAFAVAQTSDKSPRKLSLYFRKCFESMKIKAPDENELDYYYQQNYFPVRTKIVVERNVNAAFDAIGDGGNGRQSPGMKKTHKQTKGSLGSSEQPTNKNPSSKHTAKVAPIGDGGNGRQSPGVKKTYEQTKGSLGGSEQPTNKKPSSKHEAKVAPRGNFKSPKSNKATEADIALGSNKLQKKHGASQYLSPEGKGSGTKCRRTSQRTSPKTKFFSPI